MEAKTVIRLYATKRGERPRSLAESGGWIVKNHAMVSRPSTVPRLIVAAAHTTN
jgi:hypothetical protein